MEKLIERIIKGERLDEVYSYVKDKLFANGPVDISDLETLAYLCEYDTERFNSQIDSILDCLALFYKNTQKVEASSVRELIMQDMKVAIQDVFSLSYTPVQADIRVGADTKDCFSFAAPTSTGKSFVLMDMIKDCKGDVVVVVPSRALINEYYLKLCQNIQDKSVNILTFIDKINTAHARKNIFIVTPERCRQLFAHKDDFKVGIILFDEAQLADESSIRGLLFDSTVRRCRKHFPQAKLVFAHPFIDNPQAQIEKNFLGEMSADAVAYKQRNVGQMYLCIGKDGNFYHVGISKKVMGSTKMKCEFDPIRRLLQADRGCVMIYVSKNAIISGECLEVYRHYVDLCKPVANGTVREIVEKLKQYTGGSTSDKQYYYSIFIDLLLRGIVLHHGSLPMKSRLLVEEYIRLGFCRICFATSTLEQGINMPFDAILIDHFRKKDSLALKNLIGRAGRSTLQRKFDYGYVILKSPAQVSALRQMLSKKEMLKSTSSLDVKDELDEDFRDFKDAVNNGTINNDYNLTPRELEKLKQPDVRGQIESIIDNLFFKGELLDRRLLYSGGKAYRIIINGFIGIYEYYLGRKVEKGELYVLEQAIIIMLYKIYGRTFRNICWHRYSYASRLLERKRNERQGVNSPLSANFVVGYKDIPNRNTPNYPLFDRNVKAEDVSYDKIIYDTYDYLDKLVNFKLADIFYAAVMEYYGQSHNEEAWRLALLVRFGTYNEKHIWMLRYGLAFEDIERLDKYVDSIDETGIRFTGNTDELEPEYKVMIERFIY